MKTTEKLSREEFELGLKQFIGTQNYWEHNVPGAFTLILTDGANYIRQEAQAYWLFDLIATFQFDDRIQLHPFQMWQLKKLDEFWILECTRDDGEHMLTKIIDYSDFPIDLIDIWVFDGVALLPSEY